MSNINTGGPAFPVPMFSIGHARYEAQQQRLSLRDYFAAKALPVHMAALSTWNAGSQEAWQAEVSRLSYATADAMLKAREAA